jgi:D-serine deaminase-like pyridoxal phosphate-dependent protein
MTAGEPLPTFTTPALVVDLDAFEANVRAMSTLLQGSGKTVRPHVKTHRTPELARRQLGGPVQGVTCATVGEAEAMAAAGIDDILVANEVVDPNKLERLAALARRARVAVAADALEPLQWLSAAASRAGVEVGVLIDVDILLGRCGVATPEEALPLAEAAARLPGVWLRGLMGYEGRVRLTVADREAKLRRAYGKLAAVKEALDRSGFQVEVVSAAGTSTLREALAEPVITEIQAGVYVLMEPELLPMGLPFRCALAVRGTVVSRHPGRIVLDVGRRSIGQEYGAPEALGIANATVVVNDEHAIVRAPGDLPPLGAHVDLRPSQIRTTCNLHDWIWAERNGALVDRWPVSARGGSS